MQLKLGLTLAVLLAVITKGHSHLQCYVCDNCAKIDKNTPTEICGGDDATTSTTMSTSTSQMTTMSTTEASTMINSSTKEQSTTTTESTSGAVDSTTGITGPPTPATIGPVSSTTGLPTPPNVDTVLAVNPQDVHLYLTSSNNQTFNQTHSTEPTLFVTPSVVTTTTDNPITVLPTPSNVTSNLTDSSTFLVRQRRHIPENGMTYHCYKVQKKYGNVYGVQRGCMGVATEQSVCTELMIANNNQTQKCRPCSTNKCNGSSTIGVSIATLLAALVVLVYKP